MDTYTGRYAADPREIAIRERSAAYATAHAAHKANNAAENTRWLASLDAITEAYRSRVAPDDWHQAAT